MRWKYVSSALTVASRVMCSVSSILVFTENAGWGVAVGPVWLKLRRRTLERIVGCFSTLPGIVVRLKDGVFGHWMVQLGQWAAAALLHSSSPQSGQLEPRSSAPPAVTPFLIQSKDTDLKPDQAAARSARCLARLETWTAPKDPELSLPSRLEPSHAFAQTLIRSLAIYS
jgi:hypothetical protein